MAKSIPVPRELEHLLEKRETPTRRKAERRKATRDAAPGATKRRQSTRRKSDR